MQIKILSEHGYDAAMLGLSLSYNQTIENMPNVVSRLLKRDLNGGELKFLEQIMVWIDISATRYFWQEFDTYRVGIQDNPLPDCGYKINVPKQSESTMHTILKRPLQQNDFENGIYEATLTRLNDDIKNKEFFRVKDNLPEGFLQRRIMMISYKTLINILRQRANHKLPAWHHFNEYLITNLEQKEIIYELVIKPIDSILFHKDELAILKQYNFDLEYIKNNIDNILESNENEPIPLELHNLKRNLKHL